MKNYKKLEERFQRLSKLGHLGAIVGWDEAVNMPEGGGQVRAEAMAELSVITYETLTAPDMGELFSAAEGELSDLDPWQSANLKEMRSEWLKESAVTKDLVKRQSLATSKCEQAWRSLRGENNWEDFVPLLEEVVLLSREEGEQRAEATGLSKYDALMDLYQDDITSEAVDLAFEPLHDFLPDFVAEVMEQQKSEPVIWQQGPYLKDDQAALSLKLMEYVGFDFNHGRIDTSHHPFCGGVPEDVRITTRYMEADFTESFMAVIHETGHGSYEQGLPKKWREQPVGGARGMAVHEGQSLFFEMQMGRSEEFLSGTASIMQKFLGSSNDPKNFWEAENITKLFTRVVPGYIRVNADEATYPSHVILRYEIEKDLIEGKISVTDIPELWDQKMQQYLGLRTEGNYKDGCMQDVHWPGGAFGYFPTYTLGAMVAAQLFHAAEEAMPQMRGDLETGEFNKIREWLGENIWNKGSSLNFDNLMVQATGETLNSQFFIRHLKQRYLPGSM